MARPPRKEMLRMEEIQTMRDAIKGLNTDIRALQIEVAKLKVGLADAEVRIEAMRNTADLRAPRVVRA